jgi:hypothetical protein
MANEVTIPNPLEVALADLKARRAKLDNAIEAIEGLLGRPSTGGGGNTSTPVETPSRGAALAEDAFFGMSIQDAARKYLKMVKKPQSAAEIAKALEAGGMTHQSKYLPNTVRTTLIRIANNGGDLVQVKKDWALAEWYPGLRRGKREGPPQDNSDEARDEDTE